MNFTDLANRLADEAGQIARKYFRQSFEVISKADESPVTVADRAIEQRLREIIEAERPEDGIFGEEFGIKESRNGLTWVLDPIDGTKSFVIGRPTFGTLIALCENDVPMLGIIDQPITGERWIGVQGQSTLFLQKGPHPSPLPEGRGDKNGIAVKTRSCKNLKDACAGSTTPAMFPPLSLPKGGEIWRNIEPAVKMLAWGGDCYMYGLLASGFMDVCFEASLSPYDFCALVPVVEGAGGVMCDWDGKPLTMKSDGRVIAVGDAALRADLIRLLQIS